jgi:amino acid adenylation domain-containing protein
MTPAIEGFPLSAQQERVRSLRGASATLGPFCSQCVLRLPFDPGRVERAIVAAVNRYEILRTCFQSLPGMVGALQVPLAAAPVCLERSGPVGTRRILDEQQAGAFDPAAGPFVRASIMEGEAVALTVSALHADRQSVRVLARSIALLCAGEEMQLDSSPQYIDVCAWQAEERDRLSASAEWWQSIDSSEVTSAEWPFSGSGGTEGPFQVDSVGTSLDAATWAGLAEPRDVLLAAWVAVVRRFTGQDSPVIGWTLNGRGDPELRRCVGPLSSVVPLLLRAPRGIAFSDLVVAAHEAVEHSNRHGAAFGWHLLPLAAAHRPYFPSGFSFEGSDKGQVHFEELTGCIDRFDVHLGVEWASNGARLRLSYDRSRFAAEEMRRLLLCLETLLHNAVSSPGTAVDRLGLLPESERRSIASISCGPRRIFGESSVHEMFDEHARRRPGRLAVVSEEEEVTYGDLKGWSESIAARLAELGGGPETRVAICGVGGVAGIAAMLGILKAGGGSSVLDTEQPRSRLRRMLEMLSPRVVIQGEGIVEALPQGDWQLIGPERGFLPRRSSVAAAPENLAYVTFTSGSTGSPKGVAVEHRQLANYVSAIRKALDLDECESMASVSTMAADLGNTCIFGALCGGSTLHLIPRTRAIDPQWMSAYFERHRIDVLKIAPSHISALAAAGAIPFPRKRLVLGGEAPSTDLLRRLFAACGTCRIYNHYGPTETTVGVMARRLEPADAERSRVPLSAPLANTEVRILDGYGSPVPTDVPGELYIGGANLARGYLQDPALTAERFVPDHLGGRAGGRLYRTGDLARYRADGTLEILGRADRQIKIRGFRVEPGEIEQAARKLPGVRDAAVTCRSVGGETKLIAYGVSDRRDRDHASYLRSLLYSALPDYCRPEALLLIDRLPVTANGKLDIAALPVPDFLQPGTVVQDPPGTDLERAIAGVWCRVLHVEAIGVNQNFFDCGGHSLMMIEVSGLLSAELGVQLGILELFEHPTIRSLAGRIETGSRKDDYLRRSVARAQRRNAAVSDASSQ